MHPFTVDFPRRWLALTTLLLGLTACGGGTSSSPGSADGVSTPVAEADVTVLMMGNSHTLANSLPQQLDIMLRTGLPTRSVAVAVAPGSMFLDERLNHTPSVQLLRSRRWSVVILQAQKYSTSGQFTYSTFEAESLVRIAREVGALPVMFPEWPRRGVEETDRIHDLHVAIATQAPACVAPIGQAFDLVRERHPGLHLHAGDGNHSTAAGAHLAALVLYATLSGSSPLALPTMTALEGFVDAAVQAQLRQAAADTVATYPPRRWCPLDVPLVSAPPA